MKKLLIGLLLIIIVLTPGAVGIGLSPPQLRVTEAPMGENTFVATISTVNTGNEPAYMILRINCLARTREHKLRVVCNGCSREIGIQRGDLIDGMCPFCNSTDLVFYDFPPDNVLEHSINLGCKNHPLEEIDNRTYKTIDKIEPSGSANIDIYLDIPDTKEYYNQYWEARIMVISVTDMDKLSEFIVYGIDCKFLIDTQKWIEPITTAEESDFMPVIMILSSVGIVIVAIGIILFKIREKDVSIAFPKNPEEKIFKKITKGKKLL